MSIARSRRDLAVDVGVPTWADPDRYAPLALALAGKKSRISRSRARKASFTLSLMVLSFLGGAWCRDRLSTHQAEVAHAALSQTKAWIADRVGGLRTTSTEKTAHAPQPATTGLAPAGKASGAALATKVSTPEPPEVSFSSLPRAPILTHRAPVRAPVPAGDPAPVHARTAPSPSPAVEDIPAAAPAPVHARTAPSQPEADTADLIPEPKATTEDPKPTPSPRARAQEAPQPAPGSLEDLIRKEVQKEQSTKR
jgi:hypothetical protein